MPDETRTNYAALHKEELHAAIDDAAAVELLKMIDADLAREGWSPNGRTRAKIAERLAALQASTSPTASER